MFNYKFIFCLIAGLILFSSSLIFAQGKIGARVKYVHDGDTIGVVLDDEASSDFGSSKYRKIRFLGIDTPETNFSANGNNYEPQEYGIEATDSLKALLPFKAHVTLELSGKTLDDSQDKYGRILAFVILDDKDHLETLGFDEPVNTNLFLVSYGLAAPFMIYPGFLYIEEFYQACEYAINNELNMWNPEAPIEWLPFEYRAIKRGGKKNWHYYVGDIRDFKAYSPEAYWDYVRENISPKYRVYFFNSNDVEESDFEIAF
ncbi:MAG: thermonuclease family protein [Pseudomonadota bacterium]